MIKFSFKMLFCVKFNVKLLPKILSHLYGTNFNRNFLNKNTSSLFISVTSEKYFLAFEIRTNKNYQLQLQLLSKQLKTRRCSYKTKTKQQCSRWETVSSSCWSSQPPSHQVSLGPTRPLVLLETCSGVRSCAELSSTSAWCHLGSASTSSLASECFFHGLIGLVV